MQFAGQRTDMNLKPIGEPDNVLVRMTDDILPDPDAIMVTGITPQQTITDGLTEVEFLQYFQEQVSLPGTIFVGYNSVRFDDEFMRFLHYRNFYDPYEWQWQDGRSRWDMLDVVRMTRALRPDGIEWPFSSEGAPSNRLELLTDVNKINHKNAHDALADVEAVIAIARLIHNKQPKLFSYLLSIRGKKQVASLVLSDQPLVYSSGKYSNDFEKTTVVGLLAEHPGEQGGALVFDLRYDPGAFIDLKPEELAEAMRRRRDEEGPRFPLKTLKYNRCPAVAPFSVLDAGSAKRLQLDTEVVLKNHKTLLELRSDLEVTVKRALELLDKHQQARFMEDEIEVDGRLYDGFFSDSDRTKMSLVRATDENELNDLEVNFTDGRLQALFPLYIARNFPKLLYDDGRKAWEQYRTRRLLGGGTNSRMARYFARLAALADTKNITPKQQYILEELQLYAESILPEDN